MTVDYLPIANNPGANVEPQATYLAEVTGGVLVNGYQGGIVPSIRFNKTVRQSSMMTAALANFIANTLTTDVLDDGNLGALVTLIQTAIAAAAVAAVGPGVPSGVMAPFVGTAAPTGWVLCVGTIGNAASGGTRRANADTVTLFTLLWNGWNDAQAPVSGGRGANAAADYAANKTITLPDMRGRTAFGLDNLGGVAANRITNAISGITGTTMGASGGHQDTQQHTHIATSTVADAGHIHAQHPNTLYDLGTGFAAGGLGRQIGGQNTQAAVTGITVATANANFGTGTGANMPPAVVMSVIVKL